MIIQSKESELFLRKEYESAKKKQVILNQIRSLPGFIAQLKFGEYTGPVDEHWKEWYKTVFGVYPVKDQQYFTIINYNWVNGQDYDHNIYDGPTFWFFKGWEASSNKVLYIIHMALNKADIFVFDQDPDQSLKDLLVVYKVHAA
jgi:hypothetical protein